MQADEYEREHMRIHGPVRFRDRQTSKLGLAMALLFPTLIGLMIAFGLDFSVIAFMAVLGVVGVGLDLALSSYRVVLTNDTLHVQHGMRVERVPVSAIHRVVVVPHRIGASLIGRGPYRQSLNGAVRRYRRAGQRDLVRIEWRLAGRARTTLIGTDRASELEQILRELTSRRPELRVQVEHRLEHQALAEAEAEVEALLRTGREAELSRLSH